MKFDDYFPIAIKSCTADDYLYVAEIDRCVIGYFLIQRGRKPSYFDYDVLNWAQICELQVSPSLQRKGIGTLLTRFDLELM